jgi:membrane-associated phospholipid phosphatase
MRASEWVLVFYFAYTSLLALLLPLRPPIRTITIVTNLAVFTAVALAVFAYELRKNRFFSMVRDWLPFPLMLLAYREAGWFARPHYTFELERRWIVWDRLLLRGGLKAVIEAAGPVLPTLLEISYLLVYTLGPFSVAMLYVYHRRERTDRFLFIFLIGVLLCYVQFPFWPSEPPRTVFPGEDFPSYTSLFRQFNFWMLRGYGIHTSVFPSAHVAGSFSAAFAMIRILPEHKWVGRFLLIMAFLIATATVYGRYHYAVDAAAGFLMALIALGAGILRERLESRPA